MCRGGSPIGYVQRAKKREHYTITPIGGKDELVAWKLERVKFEAEWQEKQATKRTERRLSAVSIGNGGQAARELTDIEKAELSYRASRTAVKRAQPSKLMPEALTYLDPPKSLWERVKASCASIWSNAFP